ncbi:MAG: MFS transporter [Armatimonadetes bacterium]|jgi:MFS family permease|nr:MFS transporter [Armatimonadota bacterium]
MGKSATNGVTSDKSSVKATSLWIILLVAWLGWMFDGMEMGLYSVLAAPALKDLLGVHDTKVVGYYVGIMFALFLLGASLGGFIFGRMGDKYGRVKTMILTIIIYSVFTGLSAISQNTWQFGICRFIGALGLGGEWGLGVALVMETWPNARRPVLAGLLGSSSNVGFLVSALINRAFFEVLGWRLIFCIGMAPALLALPIFFAVREPQRWVKAKQSGQKSNLAQLFQQPLLGKTIIACLLSSVAIIGTWGVFQWIPTWVDDIVGGKVVSERAIAATWMAIGQIIGAFLGGPLAEWMGRRWSYVLFCVTSLASVMILYGCVTTFGPALLWLALVAGICTTTFFGWLPLYLPELFPTRIRATGEGITFNFGRIIAAAGVVFGMGQLVSTFGSYAKAATVVGMIYVLGLVLIWFAPETKGQKLPD